MKLYRLSVTDDQLRTIAAGLNELPMKHAYPVLTFLQGQVDEQDKKDAEAAAKPAEPKDPEPVQGP